MELEYIDFPNRKFGIEIEVDSNIAKNEIGMCLKKYERNHGRNIHVEVTPGYYEGWAQSIGNSYWHVKYDSTCGINSGGWEVASYICLGKDDLNNVLGAVDYLKNNSQIRTNRNCGLHIHVDVSDFTLNDIVFMLSRWIKIEDYVYWICKMKSGDKRRKKYCKPLRQKLNGKKLNGWEHSLVNWWEVLKPIKLNIHNNSEKKYSINTVGYARNLKSYTQDGRPTVELRVPPCKLDVDYIRFWTVFFLNFVHNNRNVFFVDTPTGLKYNSDLDLSFDAEEILCCCGLSHRDILFVFHHDIYWMKNELVRRLFQSRSVSSAVKESLAKHIKYSMLC